MKQEITEIIFIMDKSGSMRGMEKDTIGGFNTMLKKQQAKDGTAYVSTVLFSSNSEVIHDRIPLAEVAPMKEEDYQAGGCTALFDAIGDAIHHIQMIHKYIRKEDVPSHVIFVITTDGYENASYQYNRTMVRKMIEQMQEERGWKFLFLGANIDALEEAESFGIKREYAANYAQDSEGILENFRSLNEAVCCVREAGNVTGDWKKNIDAHYKAKKKKFHI